jgi:hypothetical protein
MRKSFARTLLIGWGIAVTVLAVGAIAGEIVILTRGFDQIKAKGVAIVDNDGTTRLLVANRDNFPAPRIRNHDVPGRVAKQPALVFYNADGSEQGALRWSSSRSGKTYSQFSGVSFDQFEQNDQLVIAASDNDHVRSAGIEGNEYRDDRSLLVLIDELNRGLSVIRDRRKRELFRERYIKEHFHGARRFYVGYDGDVSMMELNDIQGRPRLRMKVNANGIPSLQFLDSQGRATRTFLGSN